MPAISFNREFLDALLRGDKQQTTRKLTNRIKVGDTAQIYIEQRAQITGKPLRTCTKDGKWNIRELLNRRSNYPHTFYDDNGGRVYPHSLDWGAEPVRYHAHFIGKVKITEVYDMLPLRCTCGEEVWAKKDGFAGYGDASAWFESRYGEGWVDRWWTVIRWDGWMERYFKPKP